MKRLVSNGRGVLILWSALAVVTVLSMAVPALATDGVPAPPVDAPAGRALQEWGLPLTIAELGVLVAFIVPMVMGLVEFAKRLGVTGKWSMVLAMVIGVVMGGLVVAAALEVLPGWAGIAIVILLGGLLAGLAATGIYDLQNKNVKANKAVVEALSRSNARWVLAEAREISAASGYNAGDAKPFTKEAAEPLPAYDGPPRFT